MVSAAVRQGLNQPMKPAKVRGGLSARKVSVIPSRIIQATRFEKLVKRRTEAVLDRLLEENHRRAKAEGQDVPDQQEGLF